MERLRQAELHTMLDVLGELGDVEELDEFAERVLYGLERLIRCDMVGYNEVDTERGRGGYLLRPDPRPSPRLQAGFDANIGQHPLIAYIARTGDGSAHKFSDFIGLRALYRLELYCDFFREIEVRHQMAIGLTTRPPTMVGVTVNRGRRDFSEHERLLLDTARPHLTNAYRGVLARARGRSLLAALEQGLGEADPSLLVLDHDGRVQAATGKGWALVRKYFDTPDHPARLPERLEDWRQARPPAGPPLVVDAPDSRLQVESVTTAAGAAETTLLVLRERLSGLSPQTRRSLGLTKREGEVLDLVARGQTDQQIAHELVISPRTVQKHLQHVYEKLGVPSRTAAVSRALLH